jgi:hypothetical protein
LLSSSGNNRLLVSVDLDTLPAQKALKNLGKVFISDFTALEARLLNLTTAGGKARPGSIPERTAIISRLNDMRQQINVMMKLDEAWSKESAKQAKLRIKTFEQELNEKKALMDKDMRMRKSLSAYSIQQGYSYGSAKTATQNQGLSLLASQANDRAYTNLHPKTADELDLYLQEKQAMLEIVHIKELELEITKAKLQLKREDSIYALEQKIADTKNLEAQELLKHQLKEKQEIIRETLGLNKRQLTEEQEIAKATERTARAIRVRAGVQKNLTDMGLIKPKLTESEKLVGIGTKKGNDENELVQDWLRIRSGPLLRIISGIRNSILLFAFATAAVVSSFKSWIDAAKQAESAMTGLNTVAIKTGNSTLAVKSAAQDLVKDGLLTLTEASAGLKNLLATGFSLPQAIQLMNGFKDSASFGRQAALGFGEAIVGATEGLKNNNPLLLDNAGLTKNMSVILKELGLNSDDYAHIAEDATVRTKILGGVMKELSLFTGDAERLTGTYAGALAKYNAETIKMSVTAGNVLSPAMKAVLDILTQMTKVMNDAFGQKSTEITATLNVVLTNTLKILTGIVGTLKQILSIGGLGNAGFMTEALLIMGGASLTKKVGGAAGSFIQKKLFANAELLKNINPLIQGPGIYEEQLKSVVQVDSVYKTLINTFKAARIHGMGFWASMKAGATAVISIMSVFNMIVTAVTAIFIAYAYFAQKTAEAVARVDKILETRKQHELELIDYQKATIKAELEYLNNLDNTNETIKERIRLLKELKVLEFGGQVTNSPENYHVEARSSKYQILPGIGKMYGGNLLAGYSIGTNYNTNKPTLVNELTKETIDITNENLEYLKIQQNDIKNLAEANYGTVLGDKFSAFSLLLDSTIKNFTDVKYNINEFSKEVKEQLQKIKDERANIGVYGYSLIENNRINQINALNEKYPLMPGVNADGTSGTRDARYEGEYRIINEQADKDKAALSNEVKDYLKSLEFTLSMVGKEGIDKIVAEATNTIETGHKVFGKEAEKAKQLLIDTGVAQANKQVQDQIEAISYEMDKLGEGYSSLSEGQKAYDDAIKTGASHETAWILRGKTINKIILERTKAYKDSEKEFRKTIQDNKDKQNFDRFIQFARPKDIENKIKELEERKNTLDSQVVDLSIGVDGVFGTDAEIKAKIDAIEALKQKLIELYGIEPPSKNILTNPEIWNNLFSAIDNLGTSAYDTFVTFSNDAQNLQNNLTNQVRTGALTQIEYTKKVAQIEHQVFLQRQKFYKQFANAIILDTGRIILTKMRELQIEAVINAFRSGGGGLSAALGPLGIALALSAGIAAIGFASSASSGKGGDLSGIDSGNGSASSANRQASSAVQAPIQNLTIIPSLTIQADHDVFIGSNSVDEFSQIVGNNMIGIINDAVTTGEIKLPQYRG